jgi:hypothetical protein
MKRFGMLSILAVLFTSIALPAGAVTFFNLLRQAPIAKISVDQFSNPTSQHATEVEPSIFAVGSTIVAVTQEGRFTDGGASDIAFATSTDSGNTWKYGSLPGITKIQSSSNKWDRVSDASITYDAKHALWLAASLPLVSTTGQVPLVSSSPDGLNWNAPVEIGANNGDFMDKSWIVCDNSASSKYAGTCYVEWDDASQGDSMLMAASKDGGKTWSQAIHPNGAFGLGGQPVVQPNGTVVVPYLPGGGAILAFTSDNGGKTWSASVTAAPEADHQVAGNLRTSALPSARVDGSGTVYVVWQDCSFRSGCRSNDIVMTTSTDGKHWTAVARIPIDPTTSSVDHFIPGLAVEPTTRGTTAHIGLAYYFYPQANCSPQTCALQLGYISSKDGGATWGRALALGPAIHLAWIASTDQGSMVGDYIAATFAGADVHVAASAALRPGTKDDQFLITNAKVLPDDTVRVTSRGERPIPGARSDHAIRWYPPDND